MSEENEVTIEEVLMPERDYKAELKARCDLLGISYANNASEKKLAALIEAKLNESEAETEEEEAPVPKKKNITNDNKLLNAYRKEQRDPVRVSITCMNPLKKSSKGEYIIIGNKYLGTVKVFVPYNTDHSAVGFHIPYCVYKELDSRLYALSSTQKDPMTGNVIPSGRTMKEFQIVVLPDLTDEERDEIALSQKARGLV